MNKAVQQIPSKFIELENLVENAETQRDEKSVSALKHYIDTHPVIFQTVERMSTEIEEKLLNYISKGNAEKKNRLQSEINELKRQIIGVGNPNILDQLMSDEVVTSYVFVKFMDTILTRHFHNLNSLDIRKADYASSRFTRSVNALQKLRRVMPEVNLNQINIHR